MTSGPVHLCDGLKDGVVDLAVDAPVDGVDQAITLAAPGMDEERGGEDGFAAGGEDDIHGVIHPAGHDRFDAGPIGAAAEDVGRAGREGRSAGPLVGLAGESALAPVDPAVRAGIRPVEVVGASGERLAAEPFDATIGHAVAVGVGQLPDGGGRGDIKRIFEPHRPFGEHHLVGEDGLSCRTGRHDRYLPTVGSDAASRRVASGRCHWSPKNRRHRDGPDRRRRR